MIHPDFVLNVESGVAKKSILEILEIFMTQTRKDRVSVAPVGG